MTFHKVFSLLTPLLFSIFFPLYSETADRLDIDVISYEAFISCDEEADRVLKKALLEKGIVGIRDIPEYREKVEVLIDTLKAFSSLPEEVKQKYAPNRERGDLFLGYEAGKEKFKRPDGKWVVDDLKVSYYAFVPDHEKNLWPSEVPLREAFLGIGEIMSAAGEAVMRRIGIVANPSLPSIDGVPRVGRMLYYKKSQDTRADNPFWCGAHFDHGLFTALLPAVYFKEGVRVDEPEEAGLFVREQGAESFKKVVADDPSVLLFQVGEFGQLVTDDRIFATEHRVEKAIDEVERYTMALFFDAPMDTVIRSTSSLTSDSRYGGAPGDPCSYEDWTKRTFLRYIVNDEE